MNGDGCADVIAGSPPIDYYGGYTPYTPGPFPGAFVYHGYGWPDEDDTCAGTDTDTDTDTDGGADTNTPAPKPDCGCGGTTPPGAAWPLLAGVVVLRRAGLRP